MRSNADLQAIKNELAKDPSGLGYVEGEKHDDANARRMSVVRKDVQIGRKSVPAVAVFAAIAADEYLNLLPTQQNWINGLMSCGIVDASPKSEARKGLVMLFSAGSETRKNLSSLLTSPASRADQLHDEGKLEKGGIVTPSDVAAARKLS